LCREEGYQVRRTAQYCGNTGDAADCIGLPGVHIEVKRVENLNLRVAMEQATHDATAGMMPIVAHRKNNTGWLVTMRFEDWINIYREWEAGQTGVRN
jgi:hypothetical protein